MNIKTNSHFKQFIRTNVLLLLLAGFQLSAWAYDFTATTVDELKTALTNASGTASSPYEIFIKRLKSHGPCTACREIRHFHWSISAL